MSQYVHDKWGFEQGFPKGPVYAITQTSDGYLWMGTGAGLVRFDGWNFRLARDDSGAIGVAGVLGLAPGENGCLWVRLQDLTIVQYCNGEFRRPATLQNFFAISAMSGLPQGSLVAWRMDDGALALRRGAVQLLVSSQELPRSPVIAMAGMPDGSIWMGTRDAGLYRFAAGKTTAVNKGLPERKVNYLLPEGERDLWVGTDAGIVRWNGNELTGLEIPSLRKRFQALTLIRDRDGNTWAGTDSLGLLRINSRGASSLGADDEAAGEAITALFEDREGNLWIGHANGIERLRDSPFITYSGPEHLPADGGGPVYVDSEARTWFAPATGGLWWLKGAQHGKVAADGLDRDIVYSLDGGPGELWIGRQRGGLTHLRFAGDRFESVTYTHASGLAQDSIYSVYRARDGTAWAGTLSGGVSKLENGRFTNYTIQDGLASNGIAAVLQASDGAMWFATPTGLSRFADGKWRTYGVADGLPSENINCLMEDASGVLWIGTAEGIAFRSHGEFQVPAGLPASLREQIFGIAEDKSGALWMATSNHVLQVNRDELLRGAPGPAGTREFGLSDGLRGVEGVKRRQCVVSDAAGRIWFSLNRGISVVDPLRLTRNSVPAIAHIQSISADGVSIPMGDSVVIPGGSRRITFGMAGLSFSVPERVRYRYMLEGFDRTWSEPAAIREAVYTNLGPATYRLRVMAGNSDGAWGGQEADLRFRVDPLFRQTWWFRAGTATLLLFATFVLYRYRLRLTTERMRLRFQERLAERTRIAQELHDTLLQGFLSASMQVHLAADSLNEDLPAKKTLNRALELMRQVIDEGRNVVRGLRLHESASLDLEQAFSRIQQELGTREQQEGANRVGFRVVVEGEPKPLNPMLRDEIYRIGREALINAFCHAQAQQIEMEIQYNSNALRVLVRDDGCGIDPKVLKTGLDGHWGLVGMRERAERIGARLRVTSSAAAGTEIDLSVPAILAFQRADGGALPRT